MIAFVRRSILVLLLTWAALSGLVALFLYVMLRERYGRGGPMPARQAQMLLSPARRFLHTPAHMLASFGLAAGDTVLELGPGPGYFSIEAARMVGEAGRVLCIDVQPEMAALLRVRLNEAGAANAHPIIGDAVALPLPDGSVDCAFLVTVLGEIPDRPGALAELRRVLRPGGVLSIMESLTDPDYQLEASVRDLGRATGFAVVGHERHRTGYVLRLSPDGR